MVVGIRVVVFGDINNHTCYIKISLYSWNICKIMKCNHHIPKRIIKLKSPNHFILLFSLKRWYFIRLYEMIANARKSSQSWIPITALKPYWILKSIISFRLRSLIVTPYTYIQCEWGGKCLLESNFEIIIITIVKFKITLKHIISFSYLISHF